MTFSTAMYGITASVCLALLAVGVVEVRTGRLQWRPVGGKVTDVRAHGWMLVSFAALSAAQAVVMALDGPPWLLILVVVLGVAAIAVTSIAAFRRRPGPPEPAGRCTPDLAAEVFRGRPDDRP